MPITPGMRETTEVRWFGPGRPPASVVRWMHDQGAGSQVEERVDVYLRVGGCAGVGIKTREGLLEVKARGGAEAVMIGVPPIHGLVERWRKWTGGPARASELFIGAEGCVIEVPKRRVRVGIGAGHDARRLGPNIESCDGAIELTEVRVHAGLHWTLAVELFRWTSTALLADAVHKTMTNFPWGELASLTSQGYAEFLDQYRTGSPADHDAGRRALRISRTGSHT